MQAVRDLLPPPIVGPKRGEQLEIPFKVDFSYCPLYLDDIRSGSIRDLKGNELLVLIALKARANSITGMAWPSFDTIMRDTNLARGTVNAALKGLVAKDRIILEKRAGRQTNRYTVIDNFILKDGDTPFGIVQLRHLPQDAPKSIGLIKKITQTAIEDARRKKAEDRWKDFIAGTFYALVMEAENPCVRGFYIEQLSSQSRSGATLQAVAATEGDKARVFANIKKAFDNAVAYCAPAATVETADQF